MSGGARRRVVVTGLGCVTPLGNDAESTWQALLRGESGVGALEGEEFAPLPARIAGMVKGEVDAGDVDFKERRRLDRVILFALAAAREAMADSGLAQAGYPDERVGVAVGSAIGGLGTLLANHVAFLSGGPRRVSPFAIPMALANMPGAYVAIKHGLRGQNFAHVSACASGAHAIGEAARAIERGDADAVLAGGAEATTVPFVVAAFANMQALSRRNDAPERASRPFDLDRDGFVMSEGAGVLVLEAEEHARARGARIRASLLGYGASADAQHIAAPDEEGAGARACLERALRDAGLVPGDVHYVNAHATSTPAGDKSEARAIRAVFGAHADALPVSSTKSMTGHLLGAAGAVEALFCVRALETGIVPPTINLDRPDPECALDHVAGKARAVRVRIAVSNAFGFGGTNSSLVLGRDEISR
ncbi:MAG TPA: beta-ketoacyl-ACP synthase II [Myxococcota bacterium]|nr:beta-ketoacyl-ACP synthase II [Myxococcota bacterium]